MKATDFVPWWVAIITFLDPIILLLLNLTSCKPMPSGIAYWICPLMRAWVNLLHYKKLERQVWFTFIFIIEIYNEKSEDLSTIYSLVTFLFCPHAIIPPCNYICQIYPLKKRKERERKKEDYCLLLVFFVRCEIKVLVTQPHTCCFLWLLSLLPTVYRLKKVTIKF